MPILHPDAAAVLKAGKEAGRRPHEAGTPEEARAGYAAGRAAALPAPIDVAQCRDLSAPGENGPVPMRLYRAAGTAAEAVLPCLLYFHGGGWMLGNLDTHDALCRHLAQACQACVIAVDYRLAPEHPYPAAIRDGASALSYVAREAARLRIDAARIAVGGDSAGGNIAAVLALMGRDGDLPRTAFQLLIYPATDLSMSTDSYRRVTVDSGVSLTDATMRFFIDHYAPAASDRQHWHASPLRAATLKDAPPALIVTCANDPLCDEGRAYARRLDDAGVPVTELHLNDQIHGFIAMGGVIGSVGPILDFAGAILRDRWRVGTASRP
ncbi:alpha/beta hydrolase [Bordetella sp. FB-8]|uniref:alpha/beta hydrolase n=1 Tax=Bordetella sp. FB-8 TaxID=1159870 RepID=UPI00037BE141|nr:alpha/beta hydrolase [Bordetella sp. FB-8]